MSRIVAFPSASGNLPYNGEIDLRGEMFRLFHGSAQESPKSHKVLFRRARRDTNHKLIACSCVDAITREPDIDYNCPYCSPYSDGYLWDEEWVDCRRMFVRPTSTGMVVREQYEGLGEFNVAAVIYWFEVGVVPTMADRVLEMAYNTEGEILIPYVRDRMYRPDFITPFRGDYGRVEYYALYCMQKDSIDIGGL